MTVVVLLSDKRSGSTMLEEEICKHPDISPVDYTPHTFRETQHFLKGAVMLGMPSVMFMGGKRYTNFGSAANARAYLIDCVRGNVPEFIPPSDDRALVFEGWEALCARFARPVFFEKSPHHLSSWGALSLLLEWIETTPRSVRVIGLTRNPLSVQASAKELFATDPESRQYGWLMKQQNLLTLAAMLPAGIYRHVRYEDVVARPADMLAELFAFIGVDPAPAFEQRSAVNAASLEKWREDDTFTLQLAPEVRQMARTFGYSDDELDNPVPSDAAPTKTARLPPARRRRWRMRLRHFAIDRVAKPALMRLDLWQTVVAWRRR